MSKLKLLDLFCCAGGAGMGYHQAGFDVTGVDISPSKNYPFPIIQADVLALPMDYLKSFDAIHASPPCQGYSELRHAPGTVGAPKLIGQVRSMLQASGLPYVIENVEGASADMQNPITLCGSMFGLGTQGCWLQRHRLFEANWALAAPVIHRHPEGPCVGVYGGHARRRSAKHGGRGTKDTWEGGHKAAASEAMGINWATLAELSEAIPPAYTKFIGQQLMQYLVYGAKPHPHDVPGWARDDGCHEAWPGQSNHYDPARASRERWS